MEKRGKRKERVGEVISNKMAKTIVVRVERRFPHPTYRKVVTAYSKFYAHDEKNEVRKIASRCSHGKFTTSAPAMKHTTIGDRYR